jgi:hypothetical protein
LIPLRRFIRGAEWIGWIGVAAGIAGRRSGVARRRRGAVGVGAPIREEELFVARTRA